MEEGTTPAPVDGADAGRGRWGGPAVELLDEGITGLLIGGGGAVDAISGCFDVALNDTRLIFLPRALPFFPIPLSLPIVTVVTVTVPSNGYSCYSYGVTDFAHFCTLLLLFRAIDNSKIHVWRCLALI